MIAPGALAAPLALVCQARRQRFQGARARRGSAPAVAASRRRSWPVSARRA